MVRESFRRGVGQGGEACCYAFNDGQPSSARWKRSEHFSRGVEVGEPTIGKFRAGSGLGRHPEHCFSNLNVPNMAKSLVQMQVLSQ